MELGHQGCACRSGSPMPRASASSGSPPKGASADRRSPGFSRGGNPCACQLVASRTSMRERVECGKCGGRVPPGKAVASPLDPLPRQAPTLGRRCRANRWARARGRKRTLEDGPARPWDRCRACKAKTAAAGGIKSRQRGAGSGPLHEPGEQPGPRPAARGPSARSAVEAGGPQSRRLARRLPSSATFSSYSRPEASRYSTS